MKTLHDFKDACAQQSKITFNITPGRGRILVFALVESRVPCPESTANLRNIKDRSLYTSGSNPDQLITVIPKSDPTNYLFEF